MEKRFVIFCHSKKTTNVWWMYHVGFWWFLWRAIHNLWSKSTWRTLAEIFLGAVPYFFEYIVFQPGHHSGDGFLMSLQRMSHRPHWMENSWPHHPLCVWIVAKATYLWDISRWGSKKPSNPHGLMGHWLSCVGPLRKTQGSGEPLNNSPGPVKQRTGKGPRNPMVGVPGCI